MKRAPLARGEKRQTMSRKRKWRLAAALFCLFLIAVLWQILPQRMERRYDLLANGSVSFLTREAGDYGTVTEGPGMTLRAGRYRLRYAFATDAENPVTLKSDNGVDFEPAAFTVSPDRSAGVFSFLLYNETDNFLLEADYRAGSFLRCESLILEGGACTDRLFTISFLLAAASLFLLFGERMRRKLPYSLLSVLLFAVLMASIPCLKANLGLGDDMNFHLERLSNLTQGLLSGQFPVRYATYMNRGYGSVVTAFYPSAFLYPAAFMILAGASIQYAMHVLLIAIHLVSALGAFRLAQRLFGGGFVGPSARCSIPWPSTG